MKQISPQLFILIEEEKFAFSILIISRNFKENDLSAAYEF